MKNKGTPYYSGNEYADLNYSDGGLLHVVGASNYQVMRANRNHPNEADGFGYTYNHAPMITLWRNKYYVEYLANPIGEHTGAGASFLVTSPDGVNWEKPIVAFPPVRVPAGVYHCIDGTDIIVNEEKDAFMHQRMGFYHSSDDRLLISGFYGHAPNPLVCPWVNYGIGRVVREVYEDGELGDIFFIRPLYESGWTDGTLPFPLYTASQDQGFVNACEELLSDRLVTQQWAEEHGNRDPLVHIKTYRKVSDEVTEDKPYEAFCWYHISQDEIVALWKHGMVGYSNDKGETYTIKKEPTFATSGGKAWGQKTPDGRFAIAYLNSISSEHRYPLVTVTSQDGIEFDDMGVVFGEVPPRRYDGLFKDFGPQYIRGICEGHKEYPVDAMLLTHSVNKEDIWVTYIPVPIITHETKKEILDTFDDPSPYVKNWNIYSPKWAPIRKDVLPDGSKVLRIEDNDPSDYARAERVFANSAKVNISFDIMPCEWRYEEPFYIELTNDRGIIAFRLMLDINGLYGLITSETEKIWTAGKNVNWLHIKIEYDCIFSEWKVYVNNEVTYALPLKGFHKVNDISRLVFRTKSYRSAPGMEKRPVTPDLPNSDKRTDIKRVYYLKNVSIQSVE